MDITELKARLRNKVTVVSPSACGFVDKRLLPNEEEDAKEEEKVTEIYSSSDDDEDDDEDEGDDLFYALNLLSEAEDALSSILKLDKRINVLSINHYKDLSNLLQNIAEFNEQFQTDSED